MFSGVFMGFGVFLISRSKGGKNFRTRREGGAKNFRCVVRGGAKNFRPSIFSESLGKIKGHVKFFFANKVIR